MSTPAPGRKRRLIDRVVAPYVAGLAEHLSRVQDSVLDLHARLGGVEDELRDQTLRLDGNSERIRRIEEQVELLGGEAPVVRQMLRAVYERADEQRLRLYALRQTEEYELAFTEKEPLVSYVIPTYNRDRTLRDRALATILAQNYSNIEVIVSGDDSPPEIENVIREIDDPRVRFINRTVRGPYPDDPHERWMMLGTPNMNDGVAAARGRWIAIFCDDDEVTPEHAEVLVANAQEKRLENCYGRLAIRFGDGQEMDWESKFPPAYGHYTLQLAIYHAGLRFFQYEPTDVLYSEPNDWSLVRRMVAAGVRFGRIDDLVAYKYEERSKPTS